MKAEKIGPAPADMPSPEWALREIGRLKDQIAQIEIEEREIIREAEARMAQRTLLLRQSLAAREASLEKWAKAHKAELFENAKSIELATGTIGFRWTKCRV